MTLSDPAAALSASPAAFSLASHAPPQNGDRDATEALTRLFADVEAAGGGWVVIPPGLYALTGREPIRLAGNTHVTAEGAVFRPPETLCDGVRIVLFSGEDIRDFTWRVGEFRGRSFDPDAESNAWEPNANTRAILITTTPRGTTHSLRFRDIRSSGLAGAVVTVLGVAKPGSDREVATCASNVTVENCTRLDSGKFMWDYGYL